MVINRVKKGFTLAEVLITLGIIGIIAALTLPNVISNYRKKVVETRLAKFYSVINQAIKMSETVNGPKESWYWWYGLDNNSGKNEGVLLSEWFDIYLKPYIKYVRIEHPRSLDNVSIYFPDGSLFFMSHEFYEFWPEAKDYVDISNNIGNISSISTFGLNIGDASGSSLKGTREDFSGKKFFIFIYDLKKGIEPFNDPPVYDVDELTRACGGNNEVGRRYCTALIQQNGRKIPDNYPFKF